MSSTKEYILGIDLGTTNSCVAYIDPQGTPKILRSDKGYTTLPSVVGLNVRDRIVVGHSAVDQMITNPINTIYGSKRLVGRNYNSLLVQQMKELFTYPIISGPNGEAAVQLGQKTYDLYEISAMILKEIRDFAQGTLETAISKAVITVPAYYNDNQRQAVKRAGELAGLDVQRIVNEPTAAAIAYGFNKSLDQTILVYDFGGGTFDVSVLQIKDNSFTVLATGGDTFLGGVDIDNRLTAYVLEKFRNKTGKDLLYEKVAVQRLRNSTERCKIDLSLQQTSQLLLPYITEVDGEPIDLKMTLTREKLNELSLSMIERTLSMCDSVISSINLPKEKIDEILLVGGQTRMPLIRESIEKHFNKEPRKGVHPDEVVALGAAILADRVEKEAPVQLTDVLSIPIGIAIKGGVFKPILHKNVALPIQRAFKVVQKSEKDLVIDIFQGEAQSVVENEYLGTFLFPSTATTGSDRNLELRFYLSPECILSVAAKDTQTGQKTQSQMITVQTPQSLTKEFLESSPASSSGIANILKKFLPKKSS